MNRLIYIALIVNCISCFLGGCRSGRYDGDALSSAERLVVDWETSARDDYASWVQQIDSVLPLLDDSLFYYRGLVLKSRVMMFMAHADSCLALLDRVEKYCARQDTTREELRILCSRQCNMRGNILARKALMDSARVEFLRAYHWCLPTSHKDDLLGVSINLADIYVREGRFDKGAYWYRKSLALMDSLQLPEEQRFPVYYGLAQVNMELRNFEQCDFYYDLAATHYDKMNVYEKHVYLNNRGNSYYYRQDYKTALTYFLKVLAVLDSHPEMEFERHLTYVNLGETYLLLNRADSANYYLNLGNVFFQENKNNTVLYCLDTQLIGLALLEGDISLAAKRIREAVKPDYIEPNMVHNRNRYLERYFLQQGDFKKAYEYQTKNRRMDDSIRNERIKMRATEIALRYRQDSTLLKKELLLNQKRNEVLKLNQWIYLGLGFVLLGGAAGLIGFLYWKKKRDTLEWGMRTDITSLKLKNVRNCISPHFIFNVLNQVILSREGSEEEQKLMNLVKLIRYNLTLTDRLTVTLSDEIDFVKTYLALQKKSLEPDFEYTINLDAAVDEATQQIPAMLLQIPVENAVKHALRLKEGKKRLWIEVTQTAEGVIMQVRDNGGGFKAQAASYGTGTGMKVITQTIQLLNLYNSRPILIQTHDVPLEDGERGYEVRFIIPWGYSYQLEKRKE